MGNAVQISFFYKRNSLGGDIYACREVHCPPCEQGQESIWLVLVLAIQKVKNIGKKSEKTHVCSGSNGFERFAAILFVKLLFF